jgi:hypothetical protein
MILLSGDGEMLRCLLEVLVGGCMSSQGGISWALGTAMNSGGKF